MKNAIIGKYGKNETHGKIGAIVVDARPCVYRTVRH
jgi:hypothetical protein